ncbi:helix-turn-helix transcriptional regulator [Skermania piniformis]|uniref:Transcriptional regulator n=1 Tax=Skermania pinensis TaxID=39122 RepID=A0ABX8SES0_9ACTN|nr:transcriptional regulator [Skermania piniformis]
MDWGNEFHHTVVVKKVAVTETGPASPASETPVVTSDGQTRAAIVQLLLERGPITAIAISEQLGLSPAGVRRHLDVLVETGRARASGPATWQQQGRGRPAKRYQLTAAGRGALGHAYDDLAGAALRQLREIGGAAAIAEFARRRAHAVVADVPPAGADPDSRTATATAIAAAFSAAGFAATTREVGSGVQICQHHCPVSHVAEEFPELCLAETDAIGELLGTHVQQLATIANGDCACTTHVPLSNPPPADPAPTAPPSNTTTPEGAR